MTPPHHNILMMMNSDCLFGDFEEEEVLLEMHAELFTATKILDQAYKKVTPNECAKKEDYILDEERNKFKSILECHKVLFEAELGLYPHEKFIWNLRKVPFQCTISLFQFLIKDVMYFVGS